LPGRFFEARKIFIYNRRLYSSFARVPGELEPLMRWRCKSQIKTRKNRQDL